MPWYERIAPVEFKQWTGDNAAEVAALVDIYDDPRVAGAFGTRFVAGPDGEGHLFDFKPTPTIAPIGAWIKKGSYQGGGVVSDEDFRANHVEGTGYIMGTE